MQSWLSLQELHDIMKWEDSSQMRHEHKFHLCLHERCLSGGKNGRHQNLGILKIFWVFSILHFSFLISSAKALLLFSCDSLTHNFKPLTRGLNTRRAWKHSLIPHGEQCGRKFPPWNFAFHVRAVRLQPGGSDEETFTPHSCTDVHVWIHMYLHTHAFMRPVKSASGV